MNSGDKHKCIEIHTTYVMIMSWGVTLIGEKSIFYPNPAAALVVTKDKKCNEEWVA